MTQQNAPTCPKSAANEIAQRLLATFPEAGEIFTEHVLTEIIEKIMAKWHREPAAPPVWEPGPNITGKPVHEWGVPCNEEAAAPPEGETMTFTDRKHLYRIDDGNGDPLFVQAETFAEAVAKFQKWDGDDDESNYQSVAYMGDIIDESKTRE